MSNTNTGVTYICHLCHQEQTIPDHTKQQRFNCCRCGEHLIGPRQWWRPALSDALAWSALILFPAAILLPIMTIEKLGHTTSSNILYGSIHLLQSGKFIIGTVILMASIIFPLTKIIGILLINRRWLSPRWRTNVYHLIERSGKWGMLDVMLVAILVATIKLGDLVSIQLDTGLLAFTVLVLFSLAASAVFDPQSIWEHANHE